MLKGRNGETSYSLNSRHLIENGVPSAIRKLVLILKRCLNEKRNLHRIYDRLHAPQKEETSRKDHWPISVCIKLGLGVRTIRGTLRNKHEVLYVVPIKSGFLSLLERSLIAAREAVRRHTVQRCFCACHGTCFLISIPEINENPFFLS